MNADRQLFFEKFWRAIHVGEDQVRRGRTEGAVSEAGVTELLHAWSHGDASALERLTPMVYSELRRLAHRQMSGERPDHILQPSALVNEAFIRLMGGRAVGWSNRQQFFAAAAHLMRQILVDFARAAEAQKRGGRAGRAQVFEIDEFSRPEPSVSLDDVIAIDDALKTLESLDSRQAQVVELRFFGGLEHGEMAEVLGISERTVQREWKMARAFLFRALYPAE